AVFVGKNGRGPWQDMELAAFLRQFVKRQCPVIPVLLAEGEQTPELPVFLEGMTWVDFRRHDPDPMERLIWGITGKHNRQPH
ncbi:MAG: toll/interleukin-1 receptor domain-containing protein, partial [Chloroflexi bacterium]|nr:toll/interleukin-1 receptor domain-containing protein [Chloroflexota bacterium]